MTYISPSSDFALYIEDYLTVEHQTFGYLDTESVYHNLWPQNKCRSQWPIFHGPVISWRLFGGWTLYFQIMRQCDPFFDPNVNVSENHANSLLLHKNILSCNNSWKRLIKYFAKFFFVYGTYNCRGKAFYANFWKRCFQQSRPNDNVTLTSRHYICYCVCYWLWRQILWRP